MFFLMSCVTLLLSWQRDQDRGIVDLTSFWIRRVFRIVPMYYAAGLLYFVMMPPEGGFDWRQALASAIFVNAWHPELLPTVPHAWSVVPGGWSLGVEVTFYMLFPFFAALVGTWRRAVLMTIAGFVVAYVATVVAEPMLVATYGEIAAEMFLFYWFPHQFPVFALGAVLYHALLATWRAPYGRVASFLRRYGTWVLLGCAIACGVVANLPLPGRMSPVTPLSLPRPFLAAAIFMVFALALGNAPRSLWNNAWIRSLGRVSFSAYLIHFAVLHVLTGQFGSVFDVRATGYQAIFVFAALYACAVPITHGLALCTFRAIEHPMMNAGRHLLQARRSHTLVGSAA